MVASRFISELVAAAPIPLVIILALIIGLPEVQQGPRYWLATARQDEPCQHNGSTCHVGLEERCPLRRAALKVGPLRLSRGDVVSIGTGWGWRQGRGLGERLRYHIVDL